MPGWLVAFGAGLEGELHFRHAVVAASAWRALEAGDSDNVFVCTGQTAGLMDTIEPAGVIVERIVTDASERLRGTPVHGLGHVVPARAAPGPAGRAGLPRTDCAG